MEMSENDETISGSDLAIMKTEPGRNGLKIFPKFTLRYRDEASFVFRDSSGEFEQINRKFISDASLPP